MSAEVSVGAATALRLTWLLLVFRPPDDELLRGLTWGVAALGLAVPHLAGSGILWIIATLLVVARLISDWPLADNHIYLLAYWCLAISLCAAVPRPAIALGMGARWLVGAAFAFAVIWKAALSPDFVDGRFFRVTLATDERFAALVTAVGRVPIAQLAENRAALAPLPAGHEVLGGPVLVEPPAARWLAHALTWGSLVLEAAVAIAFLAPLRAPLVALRHGLLVTFALITYAVAPVGGFGWLLVAMGLAQCTTTAWRLVYLATFAIVILHAEAGLLARGLAAFAS